MCLLSYHPLEGGPVFTSNRDISIHRPAAGLVQAHAYLDKKLHFPMDHRGGSWMAHDQGRMIFLLNGYAQAPTQIENKGRSRGLILLDLFASEGFSQAWESILLAGVEPFTIVFHDGTVLMELGWDGVEKHARSCDPERPQLWMSSTLYHDEDRSRIGALYTAMELPDKRRLLRFNQENNYASIKLPAEKVPEVETTSIYQLYHEGGRIIHTESTLDERMEEV